MTKPSPRRDDARPLRPTARLVVASLVVAEGCGSHGRAAHTTTSRSPTTATPSTTTTTTSTAPRTTTAPTATTTTTAPRTTTRPPTSTSTTVPLTPAVRIWRGDTSRPRVAFRFDAGSDAGATGRILDILAANHIRASFSITGDWARANPALLLRITHDGH